MKYWARVNDAGFMQVRHSGEKPPHPDYIEVDEKVRKEPGFYEIRDGKVKKKPKAEIDKMLANRKEHEKRMERLENLLKGGG